MTDIKNILYSLLFGMVMVSCSFVDDKADDPYCQQVAQQVDLLVSVGNKASMPRRVSATASRRAATFQGMEKLVAIPFRTDGAAVTLMKPATIIATSAAGAYALTLAVLTLFPSISKETFYFVILGGLTLIGSVFQFLTTKRID